MNKFRFLSYAQEVIFEVGALAQLGQAVEHFGLERLMLITSRSIQAAGHAKTVETALGNRFVAVFDHVDPHVQDVQVDEVLSLAVETKVDGFIGLGGGSPIGMAKAVACSLEEKLAVKPERLHTPVSQPVFPIVAIPTTYAGSEMTAGFGITHSREDPPRKITINDSRAAPKLVLYDPLLTLDLPPEVTASTGMNALAHCIEALYSKTRQPFSTALAVSAIKYIATSLPLCYENGRDIQARTDMLTGAHLAGLSLSGVSMGLHHGLCHVLGGTAGVPHGIANSIILPHAIRFNADATAAELLPAVTALGLSMDGSSPVEAVNRVADAIAALSARMSLPGRLREAGVKQTDLPELARLAFTSKTVQANPKPITDISQIETILQEAW
jgi:alcohol dehydrogenase class IV